MAEGGFNRVNEDEPRPEKLPPLPDVATEIGTQPAEAAARPPSPDLPKPPTELPPPPVEPVADNPSVSTTTPTSIDNLKLDAAPTDLQDRMETIFEAGATLSDE